VACAGLGASSYRIAGLGGGALTVRDVRVVNVRT
jgi:hypothetical protein